MQQVNDTYPLHNDIKRRHAPHSSRDSHVELEKTTSKSERSFIKRKMQELPSMIEPGGQPLVA